LKEGLDCVPEQSVTVCAATSLRSKREEIPQKGDEMHSEIETKLASLPAMNKGELLKIWRECFKHNQPQHLRKELIVPILAYRIQEMAYGGLSDKVRKKLREIAQSIESEKTSRRKPASKLHIGTRLVRSWNGSLHEVSVLQEGFEYRGQVYGSLSTIAREITGTRWSGPLFFGTKRRAA
jgi:hypothetical protein